MKQLISLFCLEIQEIRGDLRRLTFLFGAALAYLIVFGMLYLPNIVTAVPCVILDEDNSSLSRHLVQDFEASDSYRIVAYVNTQEEMRQTLHEKTAIAAIDIPHDFAKKAGTGGYATVLYLVNGSNIILTNITSSAAQDILTDFSNHLAVHQTALRYGMSEETALSYIAPVAVHLRVLYNATQGYMLFFLLGLAMVAYQQGVLFAVGASSLYEAEHPENMQDAPVWAMILSKTVIYWLLGMVSYALVAVFVTQGLGIVLHASPGRLALLAGVFLLAVIGFCIFFSAFFSAELSFVRAAILYPVPAFILSGYTWPAESMGKGMQLLSQCFPLTHFSNTVRELFLIGSSPHYGECVGKLLLLALLFFVAGGVLYQRRLRISRQRMKP
ncbi:ABC transporter permease [Selenomonas caprae]|uniref:ABC transporter permease n=2 Tax=Selenomonas TaxID=970 RepID=A0A5D6VYA1_9FIRM|nr:MULTISPECIES: ABC transporter permease [Selenomonas]TYZ20490.1 ABC transporter permease [Selenomonas sp. mPRGC5]TYZ26616.1 ABC transporter permease [Selenomonas caprae]